MEKNDKAEASQHHVTDALDISFQLVHAVGDEAWIVHVIVQVDVYILFNIVLYHNFVLIVRNARDGILLHVIRQIL